MIIKETQPFHALTFTTLVFAGVFHLQNVDVENLGGENTTKGEK
jgi:hypothetical protein